MLVSPNSPNRNRTYDLSCTCQTLVKCDKLPEYYNITMDVLHKVRGTV